MGDGLAPWQRGRDKAPDAEPPAEPAAADAPMRAERPAAPTSRFAPWLRGRQDAGEDTAADAEPGADEAPLVHSVGAAQGLEEDAPPAAPLPAPPVEPRPRRSRKARPAAGKEGQKQDAIFARIRPLRVEEAQKHRPGQTVFTGGRHSTRFSVESDKVGFLLKSGPSDQLRWGIFAVLGLGFMFSLLLFGIGLAALLRAPLPTPGTIAATSVPAPLFYGCTLSVLLGALMLPCIVALRRGVHLVVDHGPGRARYRGPSGDVEFPTSFVTGMRSESALFCRSVCLQVRGRGLLFLFYSDNLEEVSRVRECLSEFIPELRGKRV